MMSDRAFDLFRNVTMTEETSQKHNDKSVIMSRKIEGGSKVDVLLQAED